MFPVPRIPSATAASAGFGSSHTISIVSAGYGFICGAYMPISQFSEGQQKVLSFLPGTYGTSMSSISISSFVPAALPACETAVCATTRMICA